MKRESVYSVQICDDKFWVKDVLNSKQIYIIVFIEESVYEMPESEQIFSEIDNRVMKEYNEIDSEWLVSIVMKSSGSWDVMLMWKEENTVHIFKNDET